VVLDVFAPVLPLVVRRDCPAGLADHIVQFGVGCHTPSPDGTDIVLRALQHRDEHATVDEQHDGDAIDEERCLLDRQLSTEFAEKLPGKQLRSGPKQPDVEERVARGSTAADSQSFSPVSRLAVSSTAI